ncbi:hypothetical protein EB796_019017 [Bugula neritina]|uniref:Peptidase M12B domain-containing protein n=1 Tax=Bugula neritina TaxID=10212 RepID=A0A7J7JAG4_BUGNE|nr:hypothetical protein EB796_019017 [Bugula neritina]
MFYRIFFSSISWYTAAVFVNGFLLIPSLGQLAVREEIYRPKATIDKSSGSSILTKKPELARNPKQYFDNLSPSKIASSQYEDEYVDMNSEVLSNGDINLKFSSHGKEHSLKLTNRKRLGDIKNVTMLTDTQRRAFFAVENNDTHSVKPLFKKSYLMHGKHQFELTPEGNNRTKVKKQLVKEAPAKSRDSVIPKEPARRKREIARDVTPISASVELAIVVDYAAWLKMSSGDVLAENETDHMVNLLLYYAHLTEIVNSMYKSMKNDDVHIEVVLAGITVITSSNELTGLTEDYKTQDDNVDSLETLERLSEWLNTSEARSILPRNDHVMLFTGYDIFEAEDGDTGTVGLAWTTRICHEKFSSSLVEVTDTFSYDASTAAHELGHSLGAGHDGVSGDSSSGCADHNYIMAAFSGSIDYLTNRFLFSCCSQRSFYATITDVGSCLMEGVPNPDHDSSIDDNVENNLPGEIFTADDQCYVAGSPAACDSTIYNKEGRSICLDLWCVLPEDSSFCYGTLTAAVDGTECAADKWCLQGECVDKSETYSQPSQNCSVTTCFTGETECTSGVNIDTPELFRCYSDSFHCDGVYECSDGTDERNCNTEFTCPSGYTKCLTGKSKWVLPDGVPRYCIYNSWLCDGVDEDCTDSSDENELCDTQTTTTAGYEGITSEQNCYICKTFDACINKEEDCETKCPDDELCIDQVKNLNSGTDTSFQSFRIIYLFIFLGYNML